MASHLSLDNVCKALYDLGPLLPTSPTLLQSTGLFAFLQTCLRAFAFTVSSSGTLFPQIVTWLTPLIPLGLYFNVTLSIYILLCTISPNTAVLLCITFLCSTYQHLTYKIIYLVHCLSPHPNISSRTVEIYDCFVPIPSLGSRIGPRWTFEQINESLDCNSIMAGNS